MSTHRCKALSLRSFRHCYAIATSLFLLTLTGAAWAQDESLADYARKLQDSKRGQVLISADEVKKLLGSVDEITRFSSGDSGLEKLAPIKRRLIGRTEAGERIIGRAKDEAQQERRVNDAAIVLKKFGLLPQEFELRSSLGEYTLNNIAGFYLPADKTMYLLNWISPELQKGIMAHELTHALQDQNFQLERFATAAQRQAKAPSPRSSQEDPSEISLARRAVVEGQASVVGCDYTIRELGISLTTSPDARKLADAYIQESYSQAIVIHNAPRLLREIMAFPYREGLQFEIALLEHGGRQEAFQGAFRRPPLNTHQVLQPEAYFRNERTPQVEIGDLSSAFGSSYQPYESGTMGELDVQIMSEEFGRENDIYTVARKWNGGSFLALKRAGLPADAEIKTSDLALIYVSRWKTQQAAERFGQIYLQAMAKRLPMRASTQHRCDEEKCAGALWEQHAPSDEGPVNVEVWPGNLLIITQSIDDARMEALRPLLLAPTRPVHASLNQEELSPRLLEMPEIRALADRMGDEFDQRIAQSLMH